MSNLTHLNDHRKPSKPLDWLARGIEAALANKLTGESVMITIDRAEAINLVRTIDEANQSTEGESND